MRTILSVRPDANGGAAHLAKIKHWCRQNNVPLNKLFNLMLKDLSEQLAYWQAGDSSLCLDIKLPARPTLPKAKKIPLQGNNILTNEARRIINAERGNS
jgi:hypothetical protein